jgi:hypothetical protein
MSDKTGLSVNNEFEISFRGHTNYPDQPRTEIALSTNATFLGDVLVAFEDFLKGMGYHFKGHINIYEEE